MRRTLIRLAALATGLLLAACSGTPSGPAGTSTNLGSPADGRADESATKPNDTPALDVRVLTRGLSHGWDIGFLPDGKVLVSERSGRFSIVDPAAGEAAQPARVTGDLGVSARGEGGLMGFVMHPDVATSGLVTACLLHQGEGQDPDVRLVTFRLSPDRGRIERVKDLLTGLPANPSGRHSGCRPTIAADGTLLVGTGDTARGPVAQDRTSLGGKVLRLNLATGEPAAGNPFLAAADRAERFVYTFGHRNVQGVAVRPGSGDVYSVEHGPDRDDEINRLRAGANYGWDPAGGRGGGAYDESVPMTDLDRFADAVPAVWRSGSPTIATSGAAFVTGAQWGAFDGALAVTALKGSKLLLVRLDRAGAVTSVSTPKELDDTYGRLRAARTGPDGALYVTSSNGDDDVLLRISPRA